MPGLAALNKNGDGQVFSVSCTSAGNCATGGSCTDANGAGQGFVASQFRG